MTTTTVDHILNRLAELISQGRFEELETEGLEIKPVPAIGNDWTEIHKTVNAFLNTRGGILILGVKDAGKGTDRHYEITEWKDEVEGKLKEFPKLFTDRNGIPQDLSDCFPPMQIRTLLEKRVAVVYVDELAADRRFVFLHGKARRRQLTGDHVIPERDIEKQEEFKEEAATAKELQPVEGMTEAELDISRLNQFIFHLNQPQQIEAFKSDLDSARAFLNRRCFVKDGKVTMLGALVCGNHPGDRLGFRSHLHGYVDLPQQIAQDKQDFVDNVIQLMESGLGYLLRNIQIGIRSEGGGTAVPQYPEEVLRETVNNALAHRDYSINKQVIVAIKPGEHIAIRNPGRFRLTSLIVDDKSPISIRRIVPEAKPRNPKLADVLRVYRRWEGRGIGMSTLVNLCLADRIDLPYYHIFNEEVCLYLRAGRLVDGRMERLFHSLDRYFAERLDGASLTEEQKRVLAYLIKSEWANDKHSYTILLSPDNNHFAALHDLERSGLIGKHPASTEIYPVYVADRVLVQRHFRRELREIFGEAFEGLKPMSQEALGVIYRYNRFSTNRHVSAKQAAFYLWYEQGGAEDSIREFDAFYRKVRKVFNYLERDGFVMKVDGTSSYLLRDDFLKTHLL